MKSHDINKELELQKLKTRIFRFARQEDNVAISLFLYMKKYILAYRNYNKRYLSYYDLSKQFDTALCKGINYYSNCIRYADNSDNETDRILRATIKDNRRLGNKPKGLTMQKVVLIVWKISDTKKLNKILIQINEERLSVKDCIKLASVNRTSFSKCSISKYYQKIEYFNSFLQGLQPESLNLDQRANFIEKLIKHIRISVESYNKLRQYNGVAGLTLKQLESYYPKELAKV